MRSPRDVNETPGSEQVTVDTRITCFFTVSPVLHSCSRLIGSFTVFRYFHSTSCCSFAIVTGSSLRSPLASTVYILPPTVTRSASIVIPPSASTMLSTFAFFTSSDTSGSPRAYFGVWLTPFGGLPLPLYTLGFSISAAAFTGLTQPLGGRPLPLYTIAGLLDVPADTMPVFSTLPEVSVFIFLRVVLYFFMMLEAVACFTLLLFIADIFIAILAFFASPLAPAVFFTVRFLFRAAAGSAALLCTVACWFLGAGTACFAALEAFAAFAARAANAFFLNSFPDKAGIVKYVGYQCRVR
mmetsp:Transcript_324/g.631  ORF Transcript_324/g.631 Transcript_324/m.631 type:complete len:297 (-) Transcript_324:35-925(-)